MEQKIRQKAINQSVIDPPALLAIIEVETGGRGFDLATGKIIIQFEPSWFRKKEPYAPTGAWSVNNVDIQRKEWEAFNSAFKINPTAAMESTSVGLGQIMGFHWKRLGYGSVGEMWDHAKTGVEGQLDQIIKFLTSDSRLRASIERKDWHTVASIYNGAGYKALAKKIGREPYNISLADAYKRYKQDLFTNQNNHHES